MRGNIYANGDEEVNVLRVFEISRATTKQRRVFENVLIEWTIKR